MSDKNGLVFEVTQRNFDSAVIDNSHKIPVVVEFMGVWSGPCTQMADEMGGFAHEFSEQFVFAKVDIDEQPDLTKQYGVENVPSIKVFINGEVVQTEEGLLTLNEMRGLLKEHGVYSRIDEMREQARAKHIAGDTLAAIQQLTDAMQKDSSNAKVAMDMVQIFLDLSELEQAKGLYNQLPTDAKKSDMGKQLMGQLTFLDLAANTVGQIELENQLLQNPNSCESRFDLAVCLIAIKSYEQAVNYLFEIINIDSSYKDGAAQEMIITVTNMLAPHNAELAGAFRRKLGSVAG